jgi:hypothetical protein
MRLRIRAVGGIAQWIAPEQPAFKNDLFKTSGSFKRRVSSKEQEKEGFSIPAQQKLLQAQARRCNIVQEYIDIETAKQIGRTNFEEMACLISAMLARLKVRNAVSPSRG